MTLRQKKLLASNDFFTVFNEVHNSHFKTMKSEIGNVEVNTNEKRTYSNKKDHGTDITFENEFKVQK